MKLQPTAKKMIFLGLKQGARAARLWDPDTCRVLISGDIQCREDVFPAKHYWPNPPAETTLSHIPFSFPAYFDSPPLEENLSSCQPGSPTTDTTNPSSLSDTPLPVDDPIRSPAATVETDPGSETQPVAPDLRRSSRTPAPVIRYGFSASDTSSAEHDHTTYSQAMKGPERAAWPQACQEEFDSLLH